MDTNTRPQNGDRFTVQVFWIAEVGRNTIMRVVAGPFVDWGVANNERNKMPEPGDFTIMRTDSVLEVDDNRKLVRDPSL